MEGIPTSLWIGEKLSNNFDVKVPTCYIEESDLIAYNSGLG
jgi:hypothetical protein